MSNGNSQSEMATAETAIDDSAVTTGLDVDREVEIFSHDAAAIDAAAEAAKAAWDPNDPMHWLPAWLTAKRVEIEGRKVSRKAWLEREAKRDECQWRYILWKWLPEAQAQVHRELQGKKERSLDTPNGRIGMRKVGAHTTVIVTDEKVALAHAARECPDAIHVERSLLVSKLKELPAPIPGTKVETTPAIDKFFIGKYTVEPKALPEPEPEPKRFTLAEFFGTPNGKEAQ